MKKYVGILALTLAFSPLAQAQVYFDSGSAQPKNAQGAYRNSARKNPQPARRAVRCRDGSITYARQHICRGHRGIRY
ncbi:MAG: hypothetical protein H7315_17265 [Herminiimonas sp.]|nr:hypothetical protein [Herminiimonas sp.]